LNCLIVEDEEMSANLLRHLVSQVSYLKLLKVCSSSIEASEVLRQEDIDLVFLDIEMPGMSGIELIKSLEKPPLVILTTSHKEYAFEAFENNAVDYLVKPLELPRFLRAVGKAKELFDQTGGKNGSFVKDYLFLKKNSVLNKVPVKEILWIEALGDYVNVHTSDTKYTLHTTLKAIESKLPKEQFVRIHRSYIIQLEHITSIDDFMISIHDKLIPVGSIYRENFMKRLNLLS
jgi:two-component system LytT family response regulator